MYVGFADSGLCSKMRRSLFECVIRGGENIIASLQDFTRGRIWKLNRSSTHLHAQNRSPRPCGPTTHNGGSLGIDTRSQKSITAIRLFCQSQEWGNKQLGGNGGGSGGRETATIRHPQAQQPVLRLGRLCLQAFWLLLSDFSRSTNAGFLAQICETIVLSLRLARIPLRQH